MAQTQPTRWMHLRGLRLDAGFTERRQAAAALGVSNSLYCGVERGVLPASDALLLRLAQFFDVKPSELIATMPVPLRDARGDETKAAA